MDIFSTMEKRLDKEMESLSPKEQSVVKFIKNNLFGFYNFIKPVLIAMTTFYIFSRIKKALGFEDALYIAVVVIIIFLRDISSKIKK